MKKILILGYGLTGKAVESFMKNKGYDVDILSDVASESTIKLEDVKKEDYYFSVRSPGVSVFSPIYKYVKKLKIKMISEIELAYKFLPNKVKLIGVTGSNGKTTTVELITKVLSKKYNVYKAGNIGLPFISLIDRLKAKDVVVLELSSFQLENIDKFHLDIAVLTSLSPNHLDSVYTLSYYYNSKLNIIKNIGDNDYFLTFLKQKNIKKLLMKQKQITDLSSYKPKIRKKKLLLKGKHNIDNIKVAYFIGKIMKVNEQDIKEAIYNFHPLPHRQEIVLKYNKCLFINDSKATSVDATLKALKVYRHKVILIIGGKDKNLDYSVLEKYHPYVYGEIKDKVHSKKKFETLDEVMKDIFDNLKGKKTILFSPGCSSYDQFKNYQERGNYFKKLCKEYVDERKS